MERISRFFSHGLCTEKLNIILQHMHASINMEISINMKMQVMLKKDVLLLCA
jgi:hypothetical protein